MFAVTELAEFYGRQAGRGPAAGCAAQRVVSASLPLGWSGPHSRACSVSRRCHATRNSPNPTGAEARAGQGRGYDRLPAAPAQADPATPHRSYLQPIATSSTTVRVNNHGPRANKQRGRPRGQRNRRPISKARTADLGPSSDRRSTASQAERQVTVEIAGAASQVSLAPILLIGWSVRESRQAA